MAIKGRIDHNRIDMIIKKRKKPIKSKAKKKSPAKKAGEGLTRTSKGPKSKGRLISSKDFKKYPKGSAEDKAAALRRKRSAKLRAKSKAARVKAASQTKAKARAARVAKIKKRGPIKQPKTRNPRKKGS